MVIMLNRKITLLILLFALFFLFNSSFFWKAMYPIYFQQEVADAAKKYNVDPYLIFAIIQIESDFKNQRISNKGAAGLMQLMPDTAEWVIEQANLPATMIQQMHNPRVNIEIGAWYIAFLERKFHQNHYAVIAAYNAGQGNVEKWLREDTWDGTQQHLGDIPFGETRHYVQRVLYFYGKYREIYQ